MLPWERRFIRGAFAAGSDDAALSVARGNGKSAVVAGLATAVVDPDGPLHGTRREVVCCASSFQQGRIVFEDVIGFLRAKGYDLSRRNNWAYRDSTNEATATHKASGSRIRCIGSDPKRAHGLRPYLVLADEPAQWQHGQADAMYAALRTGLGKVPGSRLVALGTRPADPGHWFSRLLEQAPYSQVHAAPEDAPPFRLATWRKANPSIDHLPTLKARIKTEAEEARADASLLPGFRALRLNQGTSDTERAMLLEAGTWNRAEGEAEPEGGYCLGIDLGGSAAMSAAAAYWPQSGRLVALAAFPAVPDLAARGLRDGVGDLYRRMADRGELVTHPGRVVDVSRLLGQVLGRWGTPAVICADRYREPELRQCLDKAEFPMADLAFRGQGFKDGSEDVRRFRRAVLTGNVTPSVSLLMRSAMSEAVTVADPAGNEKLAKATQAGRRARARDDAAAAAILAVAEGVRRRDELAEPEGGGRWFTA